MDGHTRTPIASLAAAGVLLAVLFVGTALSPAFATHQPANKAAVSAGSIEILGTPLTEGSSSEVVTLLTSTLKANNPTDLVLALTLECALWTDLMVIGNDNPSEAIATVKAWIEIDGVVLAVSGDDTEDAGKVVFCNRAYGLTMSSFDDDEDNHQIDTFIRTRSANAFNWFAINVGSGVHTIEVKGALEAEVNGMGTAQAGIGKRTLLIDPIQLANDVEI